MATSRVPLASKDGRSINIWIQHACLEGLATVRVPVRSIMVAGPKDRLDTVWSDVTSTIDLYVRSRLTVRVLCK